MEGEKTLRSTAPLVELGALKFEHYHTSMKGITLTNNGRLLQVNSLGQKETAIVKLKIFPNLPVQLKSNET